MPALTPANLPQAVAEYILAAVASGEFRVGDRLPTEPELARQLGIGRTSVREGLAKLKMMGVVEVRRGLGTFVIDGAPLDPEISFERWSVKHRSQIVEIFEVRISLETTAASLGAVRATPQDLQTLSQQAEAHLVAGSDLDALVKTDQDFHAALIETSHNKILKQVYNSLVPELVPYRRKSLALSGAANRSGHDHQQIVDALLRRDAVAAQAAVLNHLNTLYQEILLASNTRSQRATDPDSIVPDL